MVESVSATSEAHKPKLAVLTVFPQWLRRLVRYSSELAEGGFREVAGTDAENERACDR